MNIKIFQNTNPMKVESIGDNMPVFFMNAETYSRIKNIVNLSPKEVSWFSHVEKIEDTSAYLISGAYLVEQTVSSSETEMTTEGLYKFMESIIEEKGIKFYNEIRCWGHSHVDMSTGPSGQDMKQIQEFDNGDIYIMLIINKRGEIYSALYDFKNKIRYVNVPVILYVEDNTSFEDLQKELKEKVKERSYPKVAAGYCNPCWDAYRMNHVANEQHKTQQKDNTHIIINGQECLLEATPFEDYDDVEFEDVPSMELVDRIFTLSTEIFDDFKRSLQLSETASGMELENIIELYCSLSKANSMTEKDLIMNDFFQARLTAQMHGSIGLFFKSWDSEIQEVIAYTNTWDPDFDIADFDDSSEYYEHIIQILLDEGEDGENEDDVVSDDVKVVNEIIIKEEK